MTGFLLRATLFVVTFEKVHWSVAGDVGIADVLTILFLAAFALGDSCRRYVPKTVAVVGLFFAALLCVYLIGFFNIETNDSLTQWSKGMVKVFLHFAFVAAAVTYLARRTQRFYWRAVTAFVSGMAVNAVYALLQLLSAGVGTNLDQRVLSPLTGGASSINIYGAVNGATIFRPNALTGDPNHLAVMLDLPLLALLPIYLRLERGHRWRWPLAALLGFLFLVQLSTLSRSGALGLGVGLLILALPYRRKLVSRALLMPLGGLACVLGYLLVSRSHFFAVVIRSRLQTHGGSENAHLAIYSFVPQIIHSHPLFGLGLNTFSIYYEFVTGKSNWGPHSFYVALIVETGLVGSLVFFVFLRYLFARLAAARALGRRLSAEGDPLAARVRPLAWGFTAALAGTMAANAFYLTMQFSYFYAFVALVLALSLVFKRGSRTRATSEPILNPYLRRV